MNKQILHFITAIMVAASIASCGGVDADEQQRRQFEADIAAIEEYIERNNLTATRYPSGLHIAVLENPGGPNAENGRTVITNYIGRLTNDSIFDTNIESVARAEGIFEAGRNYSPLSFILGYRQVILGWDEGFARLQRGDKAILLVPSTLGYGNRGQRRIPPNSVLVFDVDYIDFR